jgi:hypothetical protein
MWKRKKKQQADVEVEETPSSEEEEKQVSVATEETPSPEEEQVGEVAEETPSPEEEHVGEVAEETSFEEEESPYGVFIFGKKVHGFKKFLTALFSIFLFPPFILFGLLIITSVVLLAFPLISIALPIVLLTLCILLIALPVVLPLITILALITGRGKVHFGLKNRKFAIRVFGITIPPHADR